MRQPRKKPMVCRITSFPALVILFSCHSYRIIQNQPFTRGCWILKGQLVTNTGNGITIYSCRRSLQSFHRGLPTLVLDSFSCKMLRTAHSPLQSLWAELFFLAAQVTVPTTLKAVPAILPSSQHFSIHPFLLFPRYPSHLPQVRLKKQSFPQWSFQCLKACFYNRRSETS